jgi:16S rRNA G1207 methylase RsmC
MNVRQSVLVSVNEVRELLERSERVVASSGELLVVAASALRIEVGWSNRLHGVVVSEIEVSLAVTDVN